MSRWRYWFCLSQTFSTGPVWLFTEVSFLSPFACLRIITAYPLQPPLLHWLAERVVWQTTLILVSRSLTTKLRILCRFVYLWYDVIFFLLLQTISVLSSSQGDLSKFGRGDASSPAPATTLAQTQQNQNQTHHTTQQPFLNPALPPGYSYTSLPYYTGMPGLPNAFQYGPAVFPVRNL